MKRLTEIINHVTAKIEHPELKFNGYEFETEPVYVGDGWSQEVFRLEIDKKSGSASIYCAHTDEFDVTDDVTHLFDVKKIKSAISEYMRRNMTFNYGNNYIKYLRLVESGMSEREAYEQAITV